ncbi:TRAF3-interacting protein 1-like [Sitodiplosis mosellana]|uniref:TRAF3-interacting protein 1-like n=1 Tax=Sitodiplosis mosellana TaxID=263140 RepID=UPI00244440E2|nr:TRAF3-interacting protein 1-like [Sitodiplosis mosellana]
MDDSNEFDIYEDLDVFESNEKQREKNADYSEIREKLTEAQEVIKRLQEENANLKEQIVNHQKVEGTLERNSSSLLITAKAELKRREQEIHELRKEKDNILFRRRDKLHKNVQIHNFGTQSQITCKPFVVYELKRVDDAPKERLIEQNHRRDENQASNPFAKSKENDIENKSNHKSRECFAEKNGNHRHQPTPPQTRHQDEYNLRGKSATQRSRDDERREQSNVERSKRRRSRSASKDRKRARRSRSREQQRRRDRNNHERNSPEKISRNQRARNGSKESQSPKRSTRCQSPKRSTTKPELVEKHYSKRKTDEDISKRRSSKAKSEPDKMLKVKEEKVKEKESLNHCAVPVDYSKDDAKKENSTDEKPINTNWVDVNGDNGLEEGEIDEYDAQHDDEMKSHNEEVSQNMAESQILPTLHNVKPKPEVVKPKMEINSPKKILKNDDPSEKIDEMNNKGSLPIRVDNQHVLESKPEPQPKPEIVEVHPDLEDKVEKKSKCQPAQSLDGNDNKSHQHTNVEDETLNGNDGGMEGIEMMSNVQSERDMPPEKTENMEVDAPVEMKNNENHVLNIQASRIEEPKPEIDTVKNLIKSDEPSPTAINVTDVPSLNETTPSSNNSISLTNEHGESKRTATANGLSEGIYNSVLNTSGNKSVKNISTSTKDYLIVENENNETTIYVTRKKKKKKKKSLENV